MGDSVSRPSDHRRLFQILYLVYTEVVGCFGCIPELHYPYYMKQILSN